MGYGAGGPVIISFSSFSPGEKDLSFQTVIGLSNPPRSPPPPKKCEKPRSLSSQQNTVPPTNYFPNTSSSSLRSSLFGKIASKVSRPTSDAPSSYFTTRLHYLAQGHNGEGGVGWEGQGGNVLGFRGSDGANLLPRPRGKVRFLEATSEVQRVKWYAVGVVKLVLELDPVQPECVEEGRKGLHEHEHSDGGGDPHCKSAVGDKGPGQEPPRLPGGVEREHEGEGPEYFGQLSVRKGERPQTKIGGRVRDTAEHELDTVDDLFDHHLLHVHGRGLVAENRLLLLAEQGHHLIRLLLLQPLKLLPHPLGLLSFLPLEKWDGDKHERHHRNRSRHQQVNLHLRLTVVQLVPGSKGGPAPWREEEICHSLEKVGGAVGANRGGRHPLVDNDETHVPERAAKEDDLGDETEKDPLVVPSLLREVNVVEKLEEQPKHHLGYTQDHSVLLLEGVVHVDLVCCLHPRYIEPERRRALRWRHDRRTRPLAILMADGVNNAHRGPAGLPTVGVLVTGW
eukprot:Hpha_TRINITY_DN15226_c0_g9::TRINITY_DN15226_c0_g9_i1::g.65511::m.65511